MEQEFHFDSDDLDIDSTTLTLESPVAPRRRNRRTIAAPSFTFDPEDHKGPDDDGVTRATNSAAPTTPTTTTTTMPKRVAPTPPKDAQRYKDPRRKV